MFNNQFFPVDETFYQIGMEKTQRYYIVIDFNRAFEESIELLVFNKLSGTVVCRARDTAYERVDRLILQTDIDEKVNLLSELFHLKWTIPEKGVKGNIPIPKTMDELRNYSNFLNSSPLNVQVNWIGVDESADLITFPRNTTVDLTVNLALGQSQERMPLIVKPSLVQILSDEAFEEGGALFLGKTSISLNEKTLSADRTYEWKLKLIVNRQRKSRLLIAALDLQSQKMITFVYPKYINVT
eukprot:TRINITY_DN16242_c0_g1_i1.p1 TRINITY_DN16242_c0_g1~~TRINITY_DN16242_c0_g1_i1.p1  ORF type:complete len:241 (-),score=43.54 TRINITY_DN16242_c0_g1_i1:80-802(-)